jgi:predicted regulator of Ras-like GTPase activity (Roadblock/LC7/MglB family)
MTPKKRKQRKTQQEEEGEPSVAIDFSEIETKIRETADELEDTEQKERTGKGKHDSSEAERIKQNVEKTKERDGVIGYILRNVDSASIDLKDPTKVIDYAVLSSSAWEACDELSETFSLGEVKHVIVEGNSAKLLSFTIEDNKISIFMEKKVDHKRIYKDLATK